MSYKCAKCKKIIPRGVSSAREYLIPNGVRTLCFVCYNPEVNEKFDNFQRKKSNEQQRL
jgi:DNA-directed RNA polymerase subunit RPC12/RpoP